MKSLSDREKEVVQLLAKGLKTKDIAQRLFVSVHTIDSHYLKVRERLGLNSLFALIGWAARHFPGPEDEYVANYEI